MSNPYEGGSDFHDLRSLLLSRLIAFRKMCEKEDRNFAEELKELIEETNP
jgi:hypothetical protein